jgi:hypothetical protein
MQRGLQLSLRERLPSLSSSLPWWKQVQEMKLCELLLHPCALELDDLYCLLSYPL